MYWIVRAGGRGGGWEVEDGGREVDRGWGGGRWMVRGGGWRGGRWKIDGEVGGGGWKVEGGREGEGKKVGGRGRRRGEEFKFKISMQ